MRIPMNLSVRNAILTGSLLLQLGAFRPTALAAPGEVDLAFDPGSGVNGAVTAIAVQADGRMLIGGEFTTVRGLTRTGLARLNGNGSGDAAFDSGDAADRYVTAIKVQPDGKVIFTRDFYNLSGAPPGHKVARLHTDGTLDISFTPDTGSFALGSGLTCVALQPDGKLVLGGYYNDILFGDFVRRSLLIRLNPNGTRDSGFMDGNGKYGGFVSSVALQSDGKILIAGDLASTVNGQHRFDIIRLNADGTLDEGFIPGVSGFVLAMAVQNDGKTLVGGSFIGQGKARNAIARLNVDGSMDDSFQPGTDGNSSLISLVLQSDGSVVFSGGGIYVNGISRNGMVRLNAAGNVDADFNATLGAPDNSAAIVALHPDGRLCIGGPFTKVDNLSREHVARLNTNGGLDTTFAPGGSINGPVNEIILEPDGKLLVRGQFTTVQGADRNRLARLHPSGAMDASFDPGAGVSGASFALAISAMAAQMDGKVMIGGGFNSVSGTNRYRLARLHSNGAVDDGFVSDIGGIGLDARPVQAIAMLPDNRMLIAEPGGVDGLSPVKQIARLAPSGAVDESFDPILVGAPGSYAAEATSILLQPDEKIIVTGGSLYTGYYGGLLVRLNSNGSLDTSFERTDVLGPSSISVISAAALQSDGKVLIGGNFGSIQGAGRSGIARLNSDGTLDSTFDPGLGVGGANDPAVLAIKVQPDGRILIGGSFSSFNGAACNRFTRLNPDGSRDGSWAAGFRADGAVRSIALQPDGRVLIAGDFATVNGALRPRIARLSGDTPLPPTFASWAAGFGLTGPDAFPAADPDEDGVPNAGEYILGGNPFRPSGVQTPTASLTSGSLVFTFQRLDLSETPDAALTVEASADLLTWPTTFMVGATSGTSSSGVTVLENGDAPDTIVVSIAPETHTQLFVRLRVTVTP
jgi:uncharacterized delta-60 repeat protein